MSFDITSYRISIEGLRLLTVELDEIHYHLRGLCSEYPCALHRSELSSFAGDLDKIHRRAEISIEALKSQLKADKASMKALVACYRKDNYPYPHSKKPVSQTSDITSNPSPQKEV